MKIDFHTDTPTKEATVKTYLFTDYLAFIMVGQRHEFNGEQYQVNMLENDEKGKLKNAFVWKYPPTAGTNLNSDSAGHTNINTDASSYE